MKTIKSAHVMSVAGVAAIALSTLTADATYLQKLNCTPQYVQYTPNWLRFACTDVPATTFNVYTASGTCPTVSGDSMKIWAQMVESAYLAGKTVGFNYDTPTGACAVNNLGSMWIPGI